MSKNRQPLLPTVTGKPATDPIAYSWILITASKLNIPRRMERGGGGRDRTDDLMLAKHALSQLSYAPNQAPLRVLVIPTATAQSSDQACCRSMRRDAETAYPSAKAMLEYPTGRRNERLFLRKEVIQPQVPLRLPCYDFTPVADRTVVGCLLAVSAPASGKANSHGVTGGVYKARERIHRGVLIRDY
jgi:hypothetical protein